MADVKRCDRCSAIYAPTLTVHQRLTVISLPALVPVKGRDLCPPCTDELAAWLNRSTPA